MNRLINEAVAGRLLESVVAIGSYHVDLAERRQAFLEALGDMLGADIGLWSWGRGRPESSSISAVAQVTYGIPESSLVRFAEWAFSPDAERNFTMRIRARMEGSRQATTRRVDIVPDSEWETDYRFRSILKDCGLENWLHNVRYSNHDTWSSFQFARSLGKADFVEDDVTLLDLSMTSVSWMHSHVELGEGPETFPGLTPRQRVVMLMQLEGLSRKAIARNLSISEDTVGDHLKAIYAHLDVSSSSELAALFLRSR